jgi:hypothetical protein
MFHEQSIQYDRNSPSYVDKQVRFHRRKHVHVEEHEDVRLYRHVIVAISIEYYALWFRH